MFASGDATFVLFRFGWGGWGGQGEGLGSPDLEQSKTPR
jgi:hypothetical protein